MTNVHRRKSSKEEGEGIVIAPNGLLQSNDQSVSEQKGSGDDLPPRSRSVSSPSGPSPSPLPPLYPSQSSSTGPLRTGFSLSQTKGYSASSPRAAISAPAHLRLHGGTHSRTRSISSGPFTPCSPSPLSMSFPSQDVPSSTSNTEFLPAPVSSEFPRGSRVHTNGRTNSYSQLSLNGSEPPPSPSASTHSRRHSRLHSRNLSVFFPRPGSLPHCTIAEDGAQELEIAPNIDDPPTADVPMPSASPTVSRPAQRFGEGFTFGGRPPPTANGSVVVDEQPRLPRTSRRGHHHKHSLSHNFFSFLEPGSTGPRDLTSQAASTPVSSWAINSSYPQSASLSTDSLLRAPSDTPSPVSPLSDSSTSPFSHLGDDKLPVGAIVACIGQFVLGAWLWITGQGVGSLACTGLGYWVVFDAIGVGVSTILPVYLQRPILQGQIRRPFGCASPYHGILS